MSKRSPENLTAHQLTELMQARTNEITLTTAEQIRLDKIMNDFALAIDTAEAEPAIAIEAITIILRNSLRDLTPQEMELIIKHQDLLLAKTTDVYEIAQEELREADIAKQYADEVNTKAMLAELSAQNMIEYAKDWDPDILAFDGTPWKIMLHDIRKDHPNGKQERRFILTLVDQTGADLKEYRDELNPED